MFLLPGISEYLLWNWKTVELRGLGNTLLPRCGPSYHWLRALGFLRLALVEAAPLSWPDPICHTHLVLWHWEACRRAVCIAHPLERLLCCALDGAPW